MTRFLFPDSGQLATLILRREGTRPLKSADPNANPFTMSPLAWSRRFGGSLSPSANVDQLHFSHSYSAGTDNDAVPPPDSILQKQSIIQSIPGHADLRYFYRHLAATDVSLATKVGDLCVGEAELPLPCALIPRLNR